MTDNPRPVTWPAAARRGNTLSIAIVGAEYTVGPVDTGTLLAAIGDGTVEAILPGLLADDDADRLAAQMEAPGSRMGSTLLRRIARDVIAELGQMPWWSVLALAEACRQQWTVVDGICLGRGVDLLGLPLHRMLAVAYMTVAEGMDDEQRADFQRKLWDPPPDTNQDDTGVPRRQGPRPPQWSPDEQYASFQAFTAMAGGFGG